MFTETQYSPTMVATQGLSRLSLASATALAAAASYHTAGELLAAAAAVVAETGRADRTLAYAILRSEEMAEERAKNGPTGLPMPIRWERLPHVGGWYAGSGRSFILIHPDGEGYTIAVGYYVGVVSEEEGRAAATARWTKRQ